MRSGAGPQGDSLARRPDTRRAMRNGEGGVRGGTMGSPTLKVAAESLLPLDRLEEGLEVALAEAAGPVALDHLKEECRPILRVLREDLQQVAVVVAVGEDLQPPDVLPVLVDLADTVGDVLVVRVGDR